MNNSTANIKENADVLDASLNKVNASLDKVLFEKFDAMYESGNYTELLSEISDLDPSHPYRPLFLMMIQAGEISCFDDVKKFKDLGKWSVDNAWSRYGHTEGFANLYFPLVKACVALMTRGGEISKKIGSLADDGTRKLNNLVNEVKRSGGHLSPQAGKDMQLYVDRIERETNEKMDALYLLIEDMYDTYFLVMDYYMDVCDRESYFDDQLHTILLMTIKSFTRFAPSNPSDNTREFDRRKPQKVLYLSAKSNLDKFEEIKKNAEIKKYWEEHPQEKEELLSQIASLKDKIKSCSSRTTAIQREVEEEETEKSAMTPAEIEAETIEKKILLKTNELEQLGFFKKKEKEALRQEITSLREEAATKAMTASEERKNKDAKHDAKINELLDEGRQLEAESQKFTNELEKLEQNLSNPVA